VGQDGILPGRLPDISETGFIKPAGCHPAPLTASSMDFSKLLRVANGFLESVPLPASAGRRVSFGEGDGELKFTAAR